MSDIFSTDYAQRIRRKRRRAVYSGAGLITLAMLLAVAAWITHVLVCLKAGAWGFLIAGALLAPIGVVHGVAVWFGIV